MSWKVVNTDMNYFIEKSQNICLLQNHNELSAIPLPPAPYPPLASALLTFGPALRLFAACSSDTVFLARRSSRHLVDDDDTQSQKNSPNHCSGAATTLGTRLRRRPLHPPLCARVIHPRLFQHHSPCLPSAVPLDTWLTMMT